jgi:hypothetical protein
VLTKVITPSPPSHGPTEAATMVVKVGDGVAIGCGCWQALGK